MKILDKTFLEKEYSNCKEEKIVGRWVTFTQIESLFEGLPDLFEVKNIGTSENGIPINKIVFGNGKRKILIWSQMHGNESTGTKAVFDFIKFLKNNLDNELTTAIIDNTQIHIIPMLNPDGALLYTRKNGNGIDLNRDAVDLVAKESNILRQILEEVNPEFCFNLHDQRTIFGVDGTSNPATISFLAPSEEISRKITSGRIQTMNVIVSMNRLLQQIIPGHIGRYTDEFYPTATGDNFQKLGHNTILIEAGHFPDDYDRENVRMFNFFALFQGVYHIATSSEFTIHEEYFAIPNNVKNFYDVIYRSKNNKKDIAFQYVEKIENDTFVLDLKKEKEGNLSLYHGHKEFNKNT